VTFAHYIKGVLGEHEAVGEGVEWLGGGRELQPRAYQERGRKGKITEGSFKRKKENLSAQKCSIHTAIIVWEP